VHLQELAKLFHRQPGIFDDSKHGESIDWVCSGDYESGETVRHDDMAALANDVETGSLQSLDRLLMRDARELTH